MIDRSLNYGRQHIREFLRRSMPFQTVLDIGAGHGDDLAIAAELQPRANRVAVEIFPPYVDELRSNGVEVVPIDIERDPLPFDDHSVDVVVANQILEHTKELFWIFHQTTRVLREGGHMIIGVPNLASLHNRLLLLFGRQPTSLKNASAHVRGFTMRDLVNYTSSIFPNGYHLSGFGGSNFYPFPPSVAKPLAFAFPNMAWGIFLCLEKQAHYQGEFVRFPTEERLETNFYVG